MANKHSKRYREANEVADLSTSHYSLAEALDLLAKMPKAKFDETVDLSVKLGIDPRRDSVRGVVNLPNGSGKTQRVIVFTEDADAAKAAGADEAGLDDLIARILEGWLDFDVAVATPPAMKEVRKVARVLGPRGLMPNPKSGTVTDDVEAALKEIKQGGRVEFKMDKTGCVAVVVGKRSFDKGKLEENIAAAIDSLKSSRPSELKGSKFVHSMALSATMSPSVKLEAATFAALN